jgi:hypothetical protein
MTSLKAALGCAALTASLTLAAAPAGSAFSSQGALRLVQQSRSNAVFGAVVKRKTVKSCNKGDDRKGHAKAAINAWAVACEYPPLVVPNTSAFQTALASSVAANGGA